MNKKKQVCKTNQPLFELLNELTLYPLSKKGKRTNSKQVCKQILDSIFTNNSYNSIHIISCHSLYILYSVSDKF